MHDRKEAKKTAAKEERLENMVRCMRYMSNNYKRTLDEMPKNYRRTLHKMPKKYMRPLHKMSIKKTIGEHCTRCQRSI